MGSNGEAQFYYYQDSLWGAAPAGEIDPGLRRPPSPPSSDSRPEPANLDPSDPRSATEPETHTYLDSFPQIESHVAYGRLGMGGLLGYEDKHVSVQRRGYSHALSTHGPAHVLLGLDG